MQHRGINIFLKFGLAFFMLVALLGGSLSQQVHAAAQATYYVSPGGSNSNSGTDISHPFATINHARQVVATINSSMTGDIVVYLLTGTYHESLTFGASDSGTNGHNILYTAYPGAHPLLSGGKQIRGWTLHDSSKNIWQAAIPAGFNTRQLYVNGVRAHRSASGGGLPSGTTQTTTGYVIPNTALQSYASPTDMELVYYNHWVQSRCDVASISATTTTTTVTMDQPCFGMATSWIWATMSFPTNLENAYEFLSTPGDWSIDTTHNLLSYIPRAGENLATADVEAGNTTTLITLNGTPGVPVQHLIFRGITFAYTTWLQPSQGQGFSEAQGNVMFANVAAAQNWNAAAFVTPTSGATWNGYVYGSDVVKMPATVQVIAAVNVQFLSNTFIHLGNTGIDLDGGSQNDAVTGNSFTDISGNGIQVGGFTTPNPSNVNQVNQNDVITNNYVDHVAVEFQGGLGISLGYTAGILVSHNEVSNVPYTGISEGWGWGSEDTLPTIDNGNVISYNNVHDVLQVMVDGGCYYTIGRQTNGSINNNFCRQDENGYGAIYLDQGTTGIAVNSNVIEDIANTRWLNPNPNSFDTPGNTANGNYSDTSSLGINHVTVTNTTVFADGSMPAAAQTIIANAGLQPQYQYLKPIASTTGLALWLRADAGVTLNGSTVASWSDQSGNGNTATQTTTSAQPTFVSHDINGKPALRFDGINSYLQTASPAATSRQYSMFVVSTLGTIAKTYGIPGPVYNGVANINGYGFFRTNSADYGVLDGGTGIGTFGATATVGFQIQELVRDSTGAATFYANGTQSGSSYANEPNGPSTSTFIGSESAATWDRFTGDIAEVLIYNRPLTTSERQQIEAYLTSKYAL